MFHGSIVALITPFLNGKVDTDAIKKLVDWHVQEGTQAIVACGTTGEGELLTPDEHTLVLKTVIESANNRIPVIAGCGAASTHSVIDLVNHAQKLGASAALIVTPFYVKPTQDGLFQHFKTIHDATQLPIILYNNPGRVVVDMSLDLIAQLSQMPRIVAIKDSNPDISRVITLRRRVPEGFGLLMGEDSCTSAYLANGGHGSISVVANIAPRLHRTLIDSWFKKDLDAFAQARDNLDTLIKGLSGETNPIPVKFAVAQLRQCSDEIRLPLTQASDKTQKQVSSALKEAGII